MLILGARIDLTSPCSSIQQPSHMIFEAISQQTKEEKKKPRREGRKKGSVGERWREEAKRWLTRRNNWFETSRLVQLEPFENDRMSHAEWPFSDSGTVIQRFSASLQRLWWVTLQESRMTFYWHIPRYSKQSSAHRFSDLFGFSS